MRNHICKKKNEFQAIDQGTACTYTKGLAIMDHSKRI